MATTRHDNPPLLCTPETGRDFRKTRFLGKRTRCRLKFFRRHLVKNPRQGVEVLFKITLLLLHFLELLPAALLLQAVVTGPLRYSRSD